MGFSDYTMRTQNSPGSTPTLVVKGFVFTSHSFFCPSSPWETRLFFVAEMAWEVTTSGEVPEHSTGFKASNAMVVVVVVLGVVVGGGGGGGGGREKIYFEIFFFF